MESKTYLEISDQFHALQKTLDCCDDAMERIRAFYSTAEVDRIVVIGCGSSYSLSCALANNTRQMLGIPSMAIAGGDLMIHMENYCDVFEKSTLLVTLSRSGSTHEILYATREIRAAYPAVHILSFVCTEGSNVAAASDAVLEFPWAFDASVCQTRSVTNLFAASLYVFAALAGKTDIMEGLRLLAAHGAAYQEGMKDVLRTLAGTGWTNAMVLCDGESFGVAEEAALAFNEIAYAPSSCKHVLDVRHGPVVLIDEKTVVLVKFTRAGFDYEKTLVGDLLAKKAKVVVISDEELPAIEGAVAQFAFGARLHDSVSAMLVLPAAQFLSYYKACVLGLDPDKPEGLDAWIALK